MVEENIGLEAITDSKIVNLRRVLRFIDGIFSGKINNKYDAEKIFREIMEDENLLRGYKNFSRNINAQAIATIISNLGYAVFAPLLPSKGNANDIENVDIKDMPALESEEDAAKRLATIGEGISKNRRRIKNNDTITIISKTTNFISTKTSW